MPGIHPDNLTPKQENVIVALLGEPSFAKAAALAGVGEKSIYRWLDEARLVVEADHGRHATRSCRGGGVIAQT